MPISPLFALMNCAKRDERAGECAPLSLTTPTVFAAKSDWNNHSPAISIFFLFLFLSLSLSPSPSLFPHRRPV